MLLGAWANAGGAKKVLDIGSGSGLISLMIAQRCNAQITAIDIDDGAFTQSKENFERSPWSDRLEVYRNSLQDFVSEYSGEKFDLIVSNPPYFENSFKPPTEDRTLARHSDELTLEELIEHSAELLTERGCVCLILPADLKEKTEEVATKIGLAVVCLTAVHPKPGKPAKRYLMQLQRNVESRVEDELVIEAEKRHEYSDDFKELLKDYYLYL